MKRAGLGFVVCALLAGCAPREPKPDASRPPFRSWALVTGESMLPTFAASEVVTIEHCDFSDLRPGDTVIYWHGGVRGYIHHRVFQRDEVTNRWKTKGDNNAGMDTGLLTRDVFVGRTHKFP